MDMQEYALMRTRLRSFDLIDKDGMIDIMQLAMTFLGGADESVVSVED